MVSPGKVPRKKACGQEAGFAEVCSQAGKEASTKQVSKRSALHCEDDPCKDRLSAKGHAFTHCVAGLALKFASYGLLLQGLGIMAWLPHLKYDLMPAKSREICGGWPLMKHGFRDAQARFWRWHPPCGAGLCRAPERRGWRKEGLLRVLGEGRVRECRGQGPDQACAPQ